MQSCFSASKAICSALVVLMLAVHVATAQDQPFDLKYIDPDASTAVFIHPQLVMKNPALKKLILEVDASASKYQAWRCAEIEEFKLFVQQREEKFGEHSKWIEDSTTIMRMIQPTFAKSFHEKLTRRGFVEKTQDNIAFQFKPFNDFSFPFAAFLPAEARKQIDDEKKFYADKGYIVYKIDDRTVLQSERSIPTFLNVPGIKQSDVKKPNWAEKFDVVSTKPIVLVVNLPKIGQETKIHSKAWRIPEPTGPDAILSSLLSVFWEKGDYAIITVETEKEVRVKVVVSSPNAEAAKQVFASMEGFRTLLRASIAMLKPKIAQANEKDAEQINERHRTIVDKIFKQAVIEQHDAESSAMLSIENTDLEFIGAAFLKSNMSIRDSVWKKTNQNNLKEIGGAVENYMASHVRLPTNEPSRRPGKPLVSWRVKLLPFLGFDELFKEYNQDESWDSENNKKVLAKMPSVFRHPLQHPLDTNASYFVLLGKEGIFGDGITERIKYRKIKDGLSRTLMIVEADREIPWTKPEDIEVEKGKVPEFGRKGAESFDVATADGKVHSLAAKIDAETFWALFTCAGDELVDIEKLQFSRAKPVGSKNDPDSKSQNQPRDPFDEPSKKVETPSVP